MGGDACTDRRRRERRCARDGIRRRPRVAAEPAHGDRLAPLRHSGNEWRHTMAFDLERLLKDLRGALRYPEDSTTKRALDEVLVESRRPRRRRLTALLLAA